MGIRDFVEAGRVCYINYGSDYGKLVVIVDIADVNTVLVDGIGAFPRVMYPLKRLNLTRLVIPGLLRGARTGTVAKAAKSFDLQGKWSATPASKKLAKFTRRTELTDLERFKVMIGRKQRSFAVRRLANKALKK